MAESKNAVASVRLTPELAAEVHRTAAEREIGFSEFIRDAMIAALGYCPTCGRKADGPPGTGDRP